MKASDVGVGALVVASTAAAGAVIGAAINPPCTDQPMLFCGPKVGAEFGSVYGASAAGLGGLLVAALSKKHRNVGLGAATVFGIVVATAAIKRLVSPPTTAASVT